MQPLADLRVIAVEQYGAGPFATMQLADLGADIIKIEDPATRGDVGRYIPPFQEGESSLFFESFNRGKRSVSLDLRNPAARYVFEDLVRNADAIFSNLRGDAPEKLGLTYAQLREVNPRIICCSLSGFGRTGPRSDQGAYDYTLQGLAGWQSMTGDPDGPPTKSALSLVDFSGGYVAAISIIAGVWRARRDGVGGDVDLSLFEAALAQLTYIGAWVGSHNYLPVRRERSAHQTIVPFQNFPTEDGWLVVACPKQALWESLCTALGRDDLAADPRFTTFAKRNDQRAVLIPILDQIFESRSTAVWLDILAEAGIPSAPINDVASAFADPQVVSRGALESYDHPVLGAVRQVGTPLRVDERPAPTRAPLRGEHTTSVLEELCGYTAERLAELTAAGAFGAAASTVEER